MAPPLSTLRVAAALLVEMESQVAGRHVGEMEPEAVAAVLSVMKGAAAGVVAAKMDVNKLIAVLMIMSPRPAQSLLIRMGFTAAAKAHEALPGRVSITSDAAVQGSIQNIPGRECCKLCVMWSTRGPFCLTSPLFLCPNLSTLLRWLSRF